MLRLKNIITNKVILLKHAVIVLNNTIIILSGRKVIHSANNHSLFRPLNKKSWFKEQKTEVNKDDNIYK